MKKIINILTLALILTISISCEEVKKTTFENHIIYIFNTEEDVKEREYLLSKESQDTLIKYTYQYKSDKDRNIELIYFPKTNIINFGLDDFEEIEGAEFSIDSISKSLFKKYRSKSNATDVTEPIFFNQEYGVLAIGNVMTPTFIFLPIESNLIVARKIFDKTLNKMEKTAKLIEEAKKNPNGWVYVLDKQYEGKEEVPPEFIKGAWKVNEHGVIEGDFMPNPKYLGNK